jgi:hypothetical protein
MDMCDLPPGHVELKIKITKKVLSNFYATFPVISLCLSKTCKTCKANKPLLDFDFHITCKFGRRSECKDCIAEWHRSHRLANLDTYLERQRKYDEENKEQIAAYHKEWYQENIDKIRLAHRLYARSHRKEWLANHKRRMKEDPDYNIRCSLRRAFWFCVKGMSNPGHVLELLCCSVEFFRDYMAAKFKQGMTWANHGEWEIDHIRPLSSFNMTIDEDRKKAWHYTNMQPLWVEENRSKGCKYGGPLA